jgi:glycosyltransferase involved in cell wall biosynthesis
MTLRSVEAGESTRGPEAPELSVVIPTRNRANVVRRAVASVLADLTVNVEVIVVDDGSTDDTERVLSAIDDPRLRVRRLESGGDANRARNTGAGMARSGLLAFLDSDDAFDPVRARRLIAFFSARPEIDCLVDGFVETSRGAPHVHAQPQLGPDAGRMRRLLLLHQIPLTNSSITVRRAAFEEVAGFDEAMPRHQDRELLLRLALVHAVALGDSTDVTKYRERRSISHEHRGYIAGVDALAARCPDYHLPENGDFFRYLIVRGIVKAVSTGHWVAAAQEWRAWRDARHLPKDYLRSLLAYSRGRALRSSL